MAKGLRHPRALSGEGLKGTVVLLQAARSARG